MERNRWRATVFCHTSRGVEISDVFDVEEIEDLQALIEGGPDFRSIDRIEIRYQWAKPAEVLHERVTQ